MAPKLILLLTPLAGSPLADVYVPDKMSGRDHIVLAVLDSELAEDVMQQILDCFSEYEAASGGIMTLVQLKDIDRPVRKPMTTILDSARKSDPELVELDTKSNTLPVYIAFKALPATGGKRCLPHR